jgi:hypothetical protein
MNKKENLIKKIIEINLYLCQNSLEVNDGVIYNLLRYGFKGLEKMTIQELEEELLNLNEMELAQ